ncbi:MAG: 7-cyano-7-deazaguanine synthase QueC [Thermoplasmata archaeon]|nr:MAG: 7-cyano-7-deazaguanine synthase QueC [Thermoplasmata archaeon]
MSYEHVVSVSGGMDSATVLRYSDILGKTLAVNFTYGSKHNEYERECAVRLCQHFGIDLIRLDLSNVGKALKSNLLLSGGEIPEGHYEDENMKLTVVPGRNMIFTSILAGIAESNGAGKIFLGIHSGDHAIYPDCRPEFLIAMNDAVMAGTDNKVCLEAPFIYSDKESILRWGYEHGVPYEMTRTCYKHQPLACGKCGACQERLEAFRLIGKTDPVAYEEK